MSPAPEKPTATAEPGQGTRDRLLDAATRVIVRDGYQGARLADVAREAGLTTGAVYSNFRNKEELFIAAFDRVQEARQRVMLPTGETRTFAATTRALVEMLDSFIGAEELQVLNFELGLLASRDRRVRTGLKRGISETVGEIARALPSDRELKAAGVALSRDEMATMMLALFNGLGVVAMFDPGRITPGLAKRMVRELSRGVGGEP